jgi:hypothetical protein
MTESSFGGDDEMAAGATVESSESVNSATADQEAAYDEPVSSAEGNVTGEDGVVANPIGDPANDTRSDPAPNTSYDADVEAGYDESS